MTTAAPVVTVVGGVPRSGEQIQAALTAFVGRWKGYEGTERAEAQTFLNELFRSGVAHHQHPRRDGDGTVVESVDRLLVRRTAPSPRPC